MGFKQNVAVPCLLSHTTLCPACRSAERCLPSLAHSGFVWDPWERVDGEAGRTATSTQTVYRQNQIHQLTSQHKGLALAGLFLASSGSYEVFTTDQDSLSPTQWCYGARFDPSKRPMKKKEQWLPWSKAIAVTNCCQWWQMRRKYYFFRCEKREVLIHCWDEPWLLSSTAAVRNVNPKKEGCFGPRGAGF